MAVPAAGDATGEGEVIADALPAGRYAAAVHVGPYRSETHADLADARKELLAWVSRAGPDGPRGRRPPARRPPERPDFSKWTTELTFLIAEEDSR